MRLSRLRTLLLAGAALSPGVASAQGTPDGTPSSNATAPQPDAAGGQASMSLPQATGDLNRFDEIVVTARRREENLQDVPVSVTAFSAAALEQSTIQEIKDINVIVPGLRFGSEGGKNNQAVSLRGLSQLSNAEVTPAVVNYFAGAPQPTNGSNVPTFDLSSIQVLKGPQGTLFGRNTLGGAILIEPQAPTYEFEGYVKGTYGRFDYKSLEGAVNLPIVADKVALRIAGQVRRQDGRIENLSGGPDFDNVHQDSFRASLLVEPLEGFKNTTIFSYFKADERAGGLYLYRGNPGVFPVLEPQINEYVANRKFYGAYDDGINGGRAYRRSWQVINDTSVDVGPVTLRNIFSYTKNLNEQLINTGATGPLFLPGGIPFTLFHASSREDRSYLTNEFQVLGDYDNFNFIAGAFYNHDKSAGPMGNNFVAFTPGASPAPAFTTSHVENKNFAVFAQVGINLTDRLTLNVGGRYSWDKVNACGGGAFGTPPGPVGFYVSRAECDAQAALGLAEGVGTVSNKGEEPSWTIGLDYKASDDLLLYLVSRRGYRQVNVNTPVFESRFTTGGTDPTCGLGSGQCPDFRALQTTGEEKLTDVETGAKWDFEAGYLGRGRINVAAYYSKYKGALQFLNTFGTGLPSQGVPDAPSRTAVGANAADRTIWGIELEALLRPSANFSVSFNGAYTNQKVDKISLPPGFTLRESEINQVTPTVAGTIGVSWTTPLRPLDGDVVLNGDLYMTDDFGGQQGEKFPGYSVTNVRLDWRDIGGSGLDLSAYVRNLFKEKYYTSPSVLLLTFPVSSVYVGEQQTWGLEARFRF